MTKRVILLCYRSLSCSFCFNSPKSITNSFIPTEDLKNLQSFPAILPSHISSPHCTPHIHCITTSFHLLLPQYWEVISFYKGWRSESIPTQEPTHWKVQREQLPDPSAVTHLDQGETTASSLPNCWPEVIPTLQTPMETFFENWVRMKKKVLNRWKLPIFRLLNWNNSWQSSTERTLTFKPISSLWE